MTRPLCWALALTVAFYFVWRVPPLQSPDEFLHLFRAYLIAQGEFGLVHPDAAAVARGARPFELGGGVDRSLIAFKDLHVPMMLDPKVTLAPAEKALVQGLAWSGERVYTELPGAGRYVPLVYAPHALGFWLGERLGLGVLQSYYLVRALCVLVCLWLLHRASRCARPNAVMVGIVLLPMALFQLFSPTVDGVTTALLVLGLALASGLMQGFGRAAQGRWFVAMLACVCVVVTSRQNMLPLLVLPWLVAWHQRSGRDMAMAATASVAALWWTVLALVGVPETRLEGAHSASDALAHYLRHPQALWTVVQGTVSDADGWLFYFKSTVGILGWLNVVLPDWAYVFIPVLLGGLVLVHGLGAEQPRIASAWGPGRSGPLRGGAALPALVLASGTVCVVLTFVALLLTWTPVGAETIQGVQGRYFLQPLLFMAFVFEFRPLGPRANRVAWVVVLVLAWMSVAALHTALEPRF